MQQGQVFQLKMRAVDGSAVWAYRYRTRRSGLETPAAGRVLVRA
jgi:hypothetical protein